jgi:hypothetical protein
MQSKIAIQINYAFRESREYPQILDIPKFRFFSGNVLKEATNYTKNQRVFIYAPAGLEALNLKEIQIEDNFLIKFPDECPEQEGLIGGSLGLGILNALFLKGLYKEGDRVLLIGLNSFMKLMIWTQIILNKKGRIFTLNENEDLNSEYNEFIERKNINGAYNLRKETFLDSFMEKTEGLRADIVVDFRNSHSSNDLNILIDLLAPNGRLVLHNYNIQINPPHSLALFAKNASLNFNFEESYGFYQIEIGKSLNLIDQMLEMIAKKQISISALDEIQGFQELENIEKYEKKEEEYLIRVNSK